MMEACNDWDSRRQSRPVMTPLLPQQIAPVDPQQHALTDAYLVERIFALQAYFLELRAKVDAVLAPKMPAAAGKAYPYGRCEEITRELYALLAIRLRQPETPIELLLHDFMAQGGIVRSVWGVLREQYFQNALQFGGLYIDVANDTVDVNKAPVEILPLAASGLVAVRDLAHFRRTAESYWGATIYANHLLPSLAPLLPMVSVSPGRLRSGLQSACDYMIALMCRDNFEQAEVWLLEGPTPPDEEAAVLLANTPADLRPWTDTGRDESILACQRARIAHCAADERWRQARVLDYLRSLRGPAAAS
ncbi:hypothetical protein A1342_00905 [Methylomonas methanica]|uniref:Uncharacterized protein n=2 Tax=Methylomonas TaxID=416 RepID=A0A140E5K2_9GAMM|nr:hypothetical protein [Methylomonas methanica]AMK78676.1 hypothetical protein JT25_019650 [Methylomonas denitrificans]OAI03673.1 hypothetical protein A1342_00905 [Methylomonas methanica]